MPPAGIILGYSLVGADHTTISLIIIYLGVYIISGYMGFGFHFSVRVFFRILIAILVTIFVGDFMTIIASYS